MAVELLERESFLERLRDSGPGRTVLITGEAGIGKTSLARAFARSDDRPVLWGSCDSMRTPRALGPLRDMARQSGGRLAAVMAAESSRHEKFSVLLDELTTQETLVVVEDAHWADESTLDLLLFLARRMSTTRSLLVVTYRDDEVGVDHPLLAVLSAVASDANVSRLQLPPLSPAAVGELAAASGGSSQQLHARTGSNPFFVTEILADPSWPVPTTVRDAVLGRVARLSPIERAALNSVAIWPAATPLPLLHADATAIDTLISTGILVQEGGRRAACACSGPASGSARCPPAGGRSLCPSTAVRRRIAPRRASGIAGAPCGRVHPHRPRRRRRALVGARPRGVATGRQCRP